MSAKPPLLDVPTAWSTALSKDLHRAVAVRAVFRWSRNTDQTFDVPGSRRLISRTMDRDGSESSPGADTKGVLSMVLESCGRHMLKQQATRLDYGLVILVCCRNDQGEEIEGEEPCTTEWKGGSLSKGMLGGDVVQEADHSIASASEGWPSLLARYDRLNDSCMTFAETALQAAGKLCQQLPGLVTASQPGNAQAFAEKQFFMKMGYEAQLDLEHAKTIDRHAGKALEVLDLFLRSKVGSASGETRAPSTSELQDAAAKALPFVAAIEPVVGSDLADDMRRFLAELVKGVPPSELRAIYRGLSDRLVPHLKSIASIQLDVEAGEAFRIVMAAFR